MLAFRRPVFPRDSSAVRVIPRRRNRKNLCRSWAPTTKEGEWPDDVNASVHSSLPRVFSSHEPRATRGLPSHEPRATRGLPSHELSVTRGLPSYEPRATRGLPSHEPRTTRGLPSHKPPSTRGLTSHTPREQDLTR
ncbi:hypothetical protein AVEN_107016-1 [Araneus ventricosus]|uniref:Uncharacterized protein n=1 Tax=Araneus ventricosus TaxID=182803 RepID=A0A4Y2N085_ARAVE|nr:hypothetical protein AVEN_107016-1 [Araneus ventricosus]